MITDGLVNYWPIINDLKDYVGSADMSPGTNLSVGASIGFGPDRFGNAAESIDLSNGYYTVPSGVYFNGSFAILAWVKMTAYNYGSRLLDFGNGATSDNVYVSISSETTDLPSVQIFQSLVEVGSVTGVTSLPLGNWIHLASVYSAGTPGTLAIYINGVLSASSSNALAPLNITRNLCYIGRSNNPIDSNANAYFDEIKIYNRSLSPSEIIYDMNVTSY